MDAAVKAVLAGKKPMEAVAIVSANISIPCQMLDTQVKAERQRCLSVGNMTKVNKVDTIWDREKTFDNNGNDIRGRQSLTSEHF